MLFIYMLFLVKSILQSYRNFQKPLFLNKSQFYDKLILKHTSTGFWHFIDKVAISDKC